MRLRNLYQVIYDDVFTSDRNYYRQSCPLSPSTRLTEDTEADVVIVGGGLSGLATAYYLSQTYKMNVAVLERHFVGWGASGRNGGQILPGLMAPQSRIVKKYGAERARGLWDLSIEGVRGIVGIANAHGIACDLKRGAISPVSSAYYDEKSIGEERARRESYGCPLDFLDEQQTGDMLQSRAGVYKGAFCDRENAWHFHPLKYINGLKRVLEKDVRFYERTEVIDVKSTGAKVVVSTPYAKITCKKVVLCGDSYLGALVPSVRRKYVLIRNAMMVTKPVPQDIEFMRGDLCASERGGHLLFYRKTADNRLLIGGGDAVRPNNNQVNTEGMIVDLLKKSVADIFPQLADVEADGVWGGYIGVTSSYLPYTGCLNGNVYFMGGYSGHGVNLTHVLGRLFAEMIHKERTSTGTAFDDISNMSFPGMGDFDVPLVRIGMELEAIKARFD